MGSIVLKPDETVFYPAPFVEDEVYPVVITTKRVLQTIVDKKQDKRVEMDVEKVTFVGRSQKRPRLVIGIGMIFIGLPLVILGAYWWYTVHGMPTFDEQPPSMENSDMEDPMTVRIKAVAVAAAGAILCIGGFLLGKKQTFAVVCRGPKRNMRLPVADKQQQTQLVMTLQAAMSSAKSQNKAAAAQAAAQAANAAAMAAATAPPPAKGAPPAKK